MKAYLSILAGALLLASSATADDHLFQAISVGALTFDEQTETAFNKNGHAIPDAPGQGSPFTGNHQCTPATDTESAQDHANVQPKGPNAGDCTEEEE